MWNRQRVRPSRREPDRELGRQRRGLADPWHTGETDQRPRSPGAVCTLVRTRHIGATRPFTELQSDNRSTPPSRTRSTHYKLSTSNRPKAQGKSIVRVGLTESLLRIPKKTRLTAMNRIQLTNLRRLKSTSPRPVVGRFSATVRHRGGAYPRWTKWFVCPRCDGRRNGHCANRHGRIVSTTCLKPRIPAD